MTALNSQMQSKMDALLTRKRVDFMIQQTRAVLLHAAEQIEKLPSLKGCKALKTVLSHNEVQRNKDDSGWEMAKAALGGNCFIAQAAETALDTYEERAATRTRPQDLKQYTPKQEANIREQIDMYMKRFYEMDEKLNQLYAFESCDVQEVYIDNANKRLIPVDEITTPQYNPKMKKVTLEQATLYANTANSPSAPRKLSA